MARHGSANGGVPAPEPRERGPRVSKCCAKCRRGVPGFGELPCGYNLRCPNDCHRPRTLDELLDNLDPKENQ